MKLVDTNVLVYAVNADAPQHRLAHDWLRRALADPAGLAMPWMSLLGFLRISTRGGLLPRPLAPADALGLINRWLHMPHTRVLEPTERHAALLGRLLLGAGMAGNLVNDAHLAALALEHGATVVSFDRDFARFAGVPFELLS
ncbi:MAG: PIN domain-containing protein [Rubrivivax sp.]|nr:PIN domain-containing protein [Rubrivivax sp.]